MSPPGPVGLISNPGSGHNRDRFHRVAERIGLSPAIHHVVTRSADEIGGALAQLAGRDIRVLAINGGDGTASAVLGSILESSLFETPPLIALLPGGTANMTAGDIGVRGSLLKATHRFCDWSDGDRDTTGRLERRSLLRVECPAGAAPHYGMFLGGGAIIQGTEYAHARVHNRGLRDDFSLALITLRTVWGVLRDDPAFNRHVTIEVQLDGAEPTRHDTLILAVSTLQRLAFGMRPFWGTGPGRIRLTLMQQHCSRFARTFLSIIRGRPGANAIPASGYFSHNAGYVRLELDGKLNLDGEILEPDGPVQITASTPLEFLRL